VVACTEEDERCDGDGDGGNCFSDSGRHGMLLEGMFGWMGAVSMMQDRYVGGCVVLVLEDALVVVPLEPRVRLIR
jgi:hypothetical protein